VKDTRVEGLAALPAPTMKDRTMDAAAKTTREERRWVLLWAVLIVGLTCLPYLLSWWLAPADTQYTGLLINHFDGESYYAKMQQGARGDWLFHLAFTPEPHDGAFIFTFYLALGRLAAILGLPIPLIYHLARIVCGLFLLVVAYRFISRFLEKVQSRRAAFLLLGFSAGFGWLLAPLGVIIADLWVVEGFTFLSILANPHFPLAIGLMLLLFINVLDASPPNIIPATERAAAGRQTMIRLLDSAGLGLLLAVIQPFAVPIALAVLAVYLGILALREHRLPGIGILITGVAAASAAPIMLYDLYVYNANPALVAWSAQNLTPSLPPWDYALGYGLILFLAVGGVAIAVRRRVHTDLFLLAWVGCVMVLLYVPFALQRRFITGLHVPLTLLAALGLEQIVWPRVRARRRGLVTGLLVSFTALTNLFVPLITVAGVAQGRHPLVMTADEAGAFAWLHDNSAWTDTVLAPPDSGVFVPAWAGNRVVYGHPFETIDAGMKEGEAAHFYSPEATTAERRDLLKRYGVRYVLVPSLTPTLALPSLDLTPVWTQGDAVLYRVGAHR
jgi:hypothetical protein